MDNIKQVVKDIRFLIATNCCDEIIQARIENFINERDQALRIHDVIMALPTAREVRINSEELDSSDFDKWYKERTGQ